MFNPLWIVTAWKQGFVDGLEEPFELGMGMSYNYSLLNESYDRGANFGQWLGLKIQRFVNHDAWLEWWMEQTIQKEKSR